MVRLPPAPPMGPLSPALGPFHRRRLLGHPLPRTDTPLNFRSKRTEAPIRQAGGPGMRVTGAWCSPVASAPLRPQGPPQGRGGRAAET